MASAVSKLNSFHSASQAQLRVLNTSVRSKQDMHSGRHVKSPTMMRFAPSARKTGPIGGEVALRTEDFLRAQSIGKFTVSEKVSPAKLLREKLNETTLTEGSAEGKAKVAFLESCLEAKIEPPTAAGNGNGLTTVNNAAGASPSESRKLELPKISTLIQQADFARSRGTLVHYLALKGKTEKKLATLREAAGIEQGMTFEKMMHDRFVKNAIQKAVSNSSTRPSSTLEIKKTSDVNLQTSSIRTIDHSLKASATEKKESLNNYLAFTSYLEASPDGFYKIPEGFVLLTTDIRGSSKQFKQGLSNADSFAPTVGAEKSCYADKVGPRIASVAIETAARIINEVAAQFTSSPKEAKELSSLMMNAMFSPGDGGVGMMPSGVDWPAAIKTAQQRFTEAKMDCRFLVYQSGGDVEVEVRTMNDGRKTFRVVVSKELDAQLKIQEALFSIPAAETTSSQSSSTQLDPPRVSQGIYMIPSSHLTFSAVFKTADANKLEKLQTRLTELGLSEKQTCELLNKFCSNQKDFSLKAVQGFQNIPEGNFFVCIPNEMLSAVKEAFTNTLGDKCDVTVGRQFHAASVIDKDTGQPLSTVIGSGGLFDAAEKGKIRDFRQCISEVVQNLSPNIAPEELSRLIHTFIKWDFNKAFDVAAMTEKITKYFNQELLIMAPTGLVSATN